MPWVKKLIDQGQTPSMLGETPAFYNMLQWGNTVDHNIGLPVIWEANLSKNIAHLDSLNGKVRSGHDIADLIPEATQKAMILVGASPILNDTWMELLQAEKNRFLISATNSSAKFLIDHGVIPDYVFLVDGQLGKWSLDIGEENYDTTLVCSPFAEPTTIAAWKNKILVLPFAAEQEDLDKQIKDRWGDTILFC